jgi:SAM-dependent methyltransferase
MSLQTLSEWLRCPNCFLPLAPRGTLILSCPGGHSFDVNKRGFVSLLDGSRRLTGDSAAMLDARDAFLAAGWYEPLRTALAALVAAESPSRVLDAGCGTGYYLQAVLSGRADTRALAMDLSPAAVVRSVRGDDRIDGLVADVWSPLPIRDASVDVILTVFAPRNPAEFHRVLTPRGLLAVVIPGEAHLRELRDAGLALDIHPDKTAQLLDSLGTFFTAESRQEISSVMYLAPPEVRALVGMGPSAHHTDSGALPEDDGARRPVTAAFELFGFRRR